MENGTTIVMLALIGLVLVMDGIWRRWTGKLLDRLMAKDYKEYQYFDKKYDNDVKAVETIRKVENKKLEAVMETMRREKEEEQAAAEGDDWDGEEEQLYVAGLRGPEVPGKSVPLEK